jgi:hypothetical protein
LLRKSEHDDHVLASNHGNTPCLPGKVATHLSKSHKASKATFLAFCLPQFNLLGTTEKSDHQHNPAPTLGISQRVYNLLKTQTSVSTLLSAHLPQLDSKPHLSAMTTDTPVQHLGTSSYGYEADPVAAITSYAKVMHLHTKKQMEAVKWASRRLSNDGANDVQATPTK